MPELFTHTDRQPDKLLVLAGKTRLLLLAAVCVVLFSGCDSVTRYQVISTVFDGVPELPPAVQLCDEYYLQRVAAEAENRTFIEGGDTSTVVQRSTHKPYAEKNCSSCHSSDKNQDEGLIVPKRELCLVCHKDFVRGRNVHGPVAVGDCLACHLPHSSTNVALLVSAPEKICANCHQESRLAEAMHERFVNKGIGCGECHDPHSGDAHYFLK